jgi:thiol-disulfide isomerase/thioredoxin
MSNDINSNRRLFLGTAAVAVAATLLLAVIFAVVSAARGDAVTLNDNPRPKMTHAAVGILVEGELRSLGAATAWLNSGQLTAADLRGKVVAIEFWTYSCINWMRALPYTRAWADKYSDQGLVVIGVHAPEFGFEKDLDNVRRAATDMRVDYPIAVDNDFAIWSAFNNAYWPALYLVDAKGRVRYRHFGEGDYDKSERMIQQLLREAGNAAVDREVVSINGRGVEAAADWGSLRSPENYLGYNRTQNFASPGRMTSDTRRTYVAPASLRLNSWGLVGDWTAGSAAVMLNGANGRIVYRFRARDLHLVMGPAKRGTSVRFRVLIDGRAPGAAHGIDVDEQGNGAADVQRMYQLIRQPKPIVDRVFEIEFLDAGIEAFSFTFG